MWPTTTTSLISISSVTIDELLFGELLHGTGFNRSVRLNWSNGGESPTRSTRSLVFDWRDVSFGNPINSGTSRYSFESFRSVDGVFEWSSIDWSKFVFGHISELIFTFGICERSRIMFVDVFHVCGIDNLSISFFFSSGIFFSEFGFVTFKSLLLRGWRV